MCSASSSGIWKPYSCCIASWISTNARESSPRSSNDWLGSLTVSSGTPIRLTRMPFASSNVNSRAAMYYLLHRSGQGLESGQLLLGGLAARFEEQVGEMEVPPARRAEARRDRDVGARGVPFA